MKKIKINWIYMSAIQKRLKLTRRPLTVQELLKVIFPEDYS